MDVWYLQFWDVFYQSIIGTLLFPVNTVLPPPASIHWKKMPDAVCRLLFNHNLLINFYHIKLKDGGICLSGKNVIVDNCGGASDPCDDCGHAYVILITYMCINVVYNIFILLVIKVYTKRNKGNLFSYTFSFSMVVLLFSPLHRRSVSP